MDVEFTVANRTTKVKSPVSVSMIDFEGRFLLNTRVNPRDHVIVFGTKYHGLREESLRGTMDEYTCIRKIQEILVDKIHLELSQLAINPNQLRGIRDLCAALVFEKMGIIKKGKIYGLKALTQHFCKRTIQLPNNHDAQ